MEDRVSPVNPRLDLLRREVEQKLLIPFRSHGWSAKIVREVDYDDCIEIVAKRCAVATRIAVLYSSSGISNASYRDLSNRVDRIFSRVNPICSIPSRKVSPFRWSHSATSFRFSST